MYVCMGICVRVMCMCISILLKDKQNKFLPGYYSHYFQHRNTGQAQILFVLQSLNLLLLMQPINQVRLLVRLILTSCYDLTGNQTHKLRARLSHHSKKDHSNPIVNICMLMQYMNNYMHLFCISC